MTKSLSRKERFCSRKLPTVRLSVVASSAFFVAPAVTVVAPGGSVTLLAPFRLNRMRPICKPSVVFDSMSSVTRRVAVPLVLMVYV